MKTVTKYYILGGVLLILILLTTSCGCAVKPYNKNVNYANVEGMESNENEDMEGGDMEGGDMMGGDMMGGDMEGGDMMGGDMDGGDMMDEDNIENETVNQMEGFNGGNENKKSYFNKMASSLGLPDTEAMTTKLVPKPYSENYLYDVYRSAEGSLDCGRGSMGLSNSLGPLCLSDRQQSLLITRGGNSTSPSQIGA